MKYITLILLTLLLSSCGIFSKPRDVAVPTFTRVVCEDATKLDPVKALPVVFVNAQDEEGSEVLGLRGDMYSNLVINSTETLNYILGQNKVISYYEKCIEDHNSRPLKEEGEP